MNRRVNALYAVFALSGFCGLIYESIWSHYLKLFVGHAAYAQTLVLAVFMGGMGLGAWLAAKFGARVRNLLWAYALVELIVGVFALAFHSVFVQALDWAYGSLLPATCAADGACWSQWALAALLILPQSVLLGTTFPLMTGGVLRLAPGMPGRKLALLYFLNSAGAVAGVLVSGFVLIPQAGLPGALLAAGIGNIVVAVCVYFLGKPAASSAGSMAQAASPAPDAASPSPFVRTLLAISLLTGLSSFIYEVAWIRMLSMVFGSATHSFEIMLASFIGGLALGGLWIRSRIDRWANSLRVLAIVQIAMGVLALLTLPLYSLTFDAMAWLMAGLSRNDAGYALFSVSQVAIALAVMLPATLCAGMTLPLITYQMYRGGTGERAIGWVYAANTVGAIAGVLLAVHVLMPMLGLARAMAIGAAIDIALGCYLLRRRFSGGAALGWATRALAVGALAFAVAAPLLVQFDPLRMSAGVFRGGRASFDTSNSVLYARDGKTSSIHVVRGLNGSTSLSTNGKTDGAIQMKPGEEATGDEVTMALLGALPLAYKPDAAEVAVIGFGTGMSSATLLGSPRLLRLDTIEIERAIVEAAQSFRPIVDRAFTDPRHRIVIEDAKSHFTRGRRLYDVIVSEPSNPWVSGVSSLFTEEFYARVKTHLKPDGLLVQWVQVYEITPELLASIFGALAKTFPVYAIYGGSPGDLIIVAPAQGQLPARSPALWSMPGVKAMLERVGMGSENRVAAQFVTNHRGLGPLVASYAMPNNSDFFPAVDLHGPKARFQQASATAWTLMHTAEIPLLRALDGGARIELEGEIPLRRDITPRQLPYAQARQITALVQHGQSPPADRNLVSDLPLAVAIRNRLFVCQGQNLADVPWDNVLRFAAETLPYLGVGEATAFWKAVRASPCANALGERELRWVDLLGLAAAEQWEAAGVAALASLREPELVSAYQRAVLTKIAATAHLVAGRKAEAAKLIETELPRLPAGEREQISVRLLLAHARR